MADEPESTAKGGSGRWFGKVNAWVLFGGALFALVAGSVTAWLAIKYWAPSASVAFRICKPDKLAVHVRNDGGSTAEISPMRFELSAGGVKMPRDMQAVIYADEDGKPGAPMDPEQVSSLAGGKARVYHFPTDGVYFAPEDKPCEMIVTVPIRWGKRPKDHVQKCPCAF